MGFDGKSSNLASDYHLDYSQTDTTETGELGRC
jgi:hypothetical protein